MQKFVASVLLALALLTTGMVFTHDYLVGTVYADDGDGGGE